MKCDKREGWYAYSLNLTGVNLDNTDSRRDKLLAQGIGERTDGSLGSAVDTTTGIRLTTGNTSNVDDITTAALVPLLEDGQDSLGHVDKTGNVGVKHDAHILSSNLGSLGDTLDKTTTYIAIISILNLSSRLYIQ